MPTTQLNHRRDTPHARWVGLLLMTSVLVGCQRGPNLAKVTGTVKVNGEPLPYAYVVFNPIKPPRSYGSAYANAQGQYELQFAGDSKGALVGEHKVSITSAKGDEIPVGAEFARGFVIPAKYNTDTELVREVKAGSNVIDFDLVVDAKSSLTKS